MLIEMPIKETYVPSWGAWECIRELVQNAKDQEDASGKPMRIWWSNGSLRMHNPGAELDRKALLLGHTTKENTNLRGQFGEGFNLAMLAGVRAGYEIVIDTPTERWRPSVGLSTEYNERVLQVQTRVHQKPHDGVLVSVRMEREVWDDLQKLFLFICPPTEGEAVAVKGGTILLGDDHIGRIYVKGIFVDKRPDLRFGYDLLEMKLDRDRRMIDTWDLQWKLGTLFNAAVASRPELMSEKTYELLRAGTDDVKGLNQYNCDKQVAEALAEKFRTEHGPEALPVASIQESQDVGFVGRKGVVVPDTLKRLLETVTGTADDVKRVLKRARTQSFSWDDLTPEEQANLTCAGALIDGALEELDSAQTGGVLSSVDVVTFRDPLIEGLCHVDSGRMEIARSLLATRKEVLRILVHESAHLVSRKADNTKGFDDSLQTLWATICIRLMPDETMQLLN